MKKLTFYFFTISISFLCCQFMPKSVSNIENQTSVDTINKTTIVSNTNTQNTYSVIPMPSSLIPKEGRFEIKNQLSFILNDFNNKKINTQLFINQYNTYFNTNILLINNKKASADIDIKYDSNLASDEAYSLKIESNKIQISVKDDKGLFYALQTLRQLLSLENNQATFPCCDINDAPRFAYRGMHLDVCRHIFPMATIKKYLDLMAMYKYNTFHWHLTDDQGWRFESKTYPQLTTIGGTRKETLNGTHRDKPWTYDHTPYSGFYTQTDMREIVAYAAERHITVIPEIDLPGHALAALAAYPELSCTGQQVEVGTHWGVYPDVFCPKESTFKFWENVLTEVMEVFPSEYIHIGGDECPKTKWKQCANCQALIKKEDLANETDLQRYVVNRLEKFVEKNNRKIIGWDEILDKNLSPTATIMCWQGVERGVSAAQQHLNVIMSPGKFCYFDHYQAEPKTAEPAAIGGMTTLEKVYSFEPVSPVLTADDARYVKGGQGNLWTEYIGTPEKLEYMAFPRAIALAEVLWSPVSQKNWPNFQSRLAVNERILDEMKVNYRK